MRIDTFSGFVLEQLAGLPEVSSRRMFGAHGLYVGNAFLGIIHEGRLYFKTDNASRTAYLEHGMSPFQPSPRQTLRSYDEVPAPILEQPEQLVAWARRALEVAG